MKKIFSIFVICMMLICLTACGSTGGEPSSPSQFTVSASPSASPSEAPQQPDASSSAAPSAVQPSEASSRELVVYFSATGNTQQVAQMLGEMRGADIYEIVPQQPYTEEDLDYNDDSCRANIEQNDQTARPAISGSIENIDDYDVIYVGFPIWWGSLPKILYTFFDAYDLSGKVIAPFCTSGSSGISSAADEIERLEPSATVVQGMRVDTSHIEDDLTQWLESIDLGQ